MAGPGRPAGRAIRLLQPIGRGGFGTVFLAEVRGPEGLVQRLAVKLIHERWAADTGIAARARDEARLMSQLNHDNVVRIHGLTRIGGRSAVLMEYVEGVDAGTLAAAGGPGDGLSLRIVARIGELVAAALDAAWHSLSPVTGAPLHVVHRDIKPANVLVSAGGAVKVMDFGIARAELDREAQTGSAQFGTGRYMAPERWLYGEAGAESDVFSLGVTLWELCTGRPMGRLPLDRVSFDDALDERLAELGTGEGRRLAGVLRDMLAFEPHERCTAAMVVEALNQLADTASGPGLRRFARQEIPRLRDARLQALGTEPDVETLTGTVYTGLARDSNDTFAGLYLPDETSAVPLAGGGPLAALGTESVSAGQARPAESAFQVAPDPAPVRSRWAPVALVALVSLGSAAWWVQPPRSPPGPEPAVQEAMGETLPAAPGPAEPVLAEPDAVDAVDADPAPSAPAPRPRPVAVRPASATGPAATPAPFPTAESGVQEITLPASSSVAPDGHEAPHVIVIDDRAAPAPAPPAAPAAAVLVTVKVLADPREGTLTLGDHTAQVGDSLTVPVGLYTARFEGPSWRTTCQVELTPSSTKLKFDRKGARCLTP